MGGSAAVVPADGASSGSSSSSGSIVSGTLKNRNAVAALVSEAMGAVLQMAHNELLVGPPARPRGGGEDMGAASVSLPVLLGLLENCDGCCGTMLGEVRPNTHYTYWYLHFTSV